MSRRSKRNLKKSPASSPQPPPKPPDSVKEGTVHPTKPASSTVFARFVGASPVKKPAISGLPADSGKGPLEDQAAVLEAMETESGVVNDASAKPLPEVTPEGRFSQRENLTQKDDAIAATPAEREMKEEAESERQPEASDQPLPATPTATADKPDESAAVSTDAVDDEMETGNGTKMTQDEIAALLRPDPEAEEVPTSAADAEMKDIEVSGDDDNEEDENGSAATSGADDNNSGPKPATDDVDDDVDDAEEASEADDVTNESAENSADGEADDEDYEDLDSDKKSDDDDDADTAAKAVNTEGRGGVDINFKTPPLRSRDIAATNTRKRTS